MRLIRVGVRGGTPYFEESSKLVELEKRQRWVVAKKVLKPLLLIHFIYI